MRSLTCAPAPNGEIKIKIKIIVDRRDTRNPVVITLQQLGASLEIKTIEVGDYIVSDQCAFEYKSTNDFLESVIGDERGKLFRQCSDLVAAYKKPALLIGCNLNDLFAERNIAPQAILGMLQTVLWIGCPVRFLPSPEITANYIFECAKKEQEEYTSIFMEHGNKKVKTPLEEKFYIVSAIPGIGTALAESLLRRFGSIEYIAIATQQELESVHGIGEITAKKIREVLTDYAYSL